MTSHASEAERLAFDRIAPLLQAEGYTLIPQPGHADLPPFLAGMQPDAIAIGRKPSLLVELIRKDRGTEACRVRKFRSLVEGQDGWELRLFYFSSTDPTFTVVPDVDAKAAVEAARHLSGVEPRAALLFAGSIVEAAARRTSEEAGSRPLNPRALVNFLAGEGLIDQDQESEMFRLSDMRNRLAHGRLDVAPPTEDISWLLSVAAQVSRQ